jgi:hypothetical protein
VVGLDICLNHDKSNGRVFMSLPFSCINHQLKSCKDLQNQKTTFHELLERRGMEGLGKKSCRERKIPN